MGPPTREAAPGLGPGSTLRNERRRLAAWPVPLSPPPAPHRDRPPSLGPAAKRLPHLAQRDTLCRGDSTQHPGIVGWGATLGMKDTGFYRQPPNPAARGTLSRDWERSGGTTAASRKARSPSRSRDSGEGRKGPETSQGGDGVRTEGLLPCRGFTEEPARPSPRDRGLAGTRPREPAPHAPAT